MAKDVFRVVKTSFWTDEKIIDMFSPEDKYFMLYLITNDHTTQLGIYKLLPKVAAFETGYSVDVINVLLDRFENKYEIIKYSRETNEIAIKNYLRHAIIRGGPKVLKCMINEYHQVKDKSLIIYIYNNIYNRNDINNTVIELVNYIYNNNKELMKNEGNKPVTSLLQENQSCQGFEGDSEGVSKPSKGGFKPPTVEEVDAYCIEKNHEYVDPEAFVLFYESKNWYVGKNKMASWKAAVGGWNARDKASGKPKYNRQQPVVEDYTIEDDEEWQVV